MDRALVAGGGNLRVQERFVGGRGSRLEDLPDPDRLSVESQVIAPTALGREDEPPLGSGPAGPERLVLESDLESLERQLVGLLHDELPQALGVADHAPALV